MPQLNLYLDKQTLTKLETAARTENVSMSKWVRSRLSHALSSSWPEGYFELFGALKDFDVKRPAPLSFAQDAKRRF